MNFSFDLTPRDLAAAYKLQLGGWRGIAKRAASFGFQVACAVFFALLIGDYKQPRIYAAGVVGLFVFVWILYLWYRHLRVDHIARNRAWMLVPRTISVNELGVESTSAEQMTRHAWPLVSHVIVTQEVAVFHCASDLLIVLPGRAIPDRPAFLEFLRAHCKGRLTLKGCPTCGYDISKSSGACPECGLGSSTPPAAT